MDVEFEVYKEERNFRTIIGIGIASIVFFALTTFWILDLKNPPHNFPIESDLIIEEGMGSKEIAYHLKDNHFVKSALIALWYLKQSGVFALAGSYHFTAPLRTEALIHSIVSGENRSPLLKVTLPEGFRARDLKAILPTQFGEERDESLDSLDGTLFPDTYFIEKGMRGDEFITLLQNTQTEKLHSYEEEIASSGLSTQDVLILASLVEREAKDQESKLRVASILKKRLSIDMPLQVDATFNYIFGKTSAELTDDDLTADSPFNTYINTGLPPHAIANPGIESIEAVLRGEETSYLYYLTSVEGTFYYAKTFEEHKRNKERYLR